MVDPSERQRWMSGLLRSWAGQRWAECGARLLAAAGAADQMGQLILTGREYNCQLVRAGRGRQSARPGCGDESWVVLVSPRVREES